MAITKASNLASVGSGLGTQPSQPIDVGIGITIDGNSGVITATSKGNFGNVTIDGTGIGIITANTFDGTATNSGSASRLGIGATGYSLVLSGDLTAANVTVGGTLTYDDVTNIDSLGIITARSYVSIADSILHTGDTDTAIRFPAADTFTVETGGSERVRVDSSGKFGIGTDSPRGKLEVSDGTSNTAGEAINEAYIVGATTGSSEGILTIQSNDAMASDKGGSIAFGGRAITSNTAGANWAFINGYKENGTTANYGGYLSFATRPNSGSISERMRIDSSGRLLSGTSSTSATCTAVFSKRSDGAADPVVRLEVNSTSPVDGTALGGFNFASSGLSGFQAGARIAAVRDGGTWTNGSSHPTYLEFATTADGDSSPTERMRITSTGGIHFSNGEIIERVKITAGKLSDNTNIDLENGNVHHFTTTETTTSTPNIRVNSSTSLNSVMAIGDTISVTLITTAAAAGYSAQLTIDGSAVTERWNGGSAPSAGGSSGNDVITYQIIKTADATYTVLANVTNFA